LLVSDARIRQSLVEIGREFYRRGWVLGTSGNFSAVVSPKPLKLLITPSAAHKGRLRDADFLVIDGSGKVARGSKGRPSAETLLHLEIVRARRAACVLHTHSVWSTMISERHAHEQRVAIEGYEMLKGLEGVQSHKHREWVPILENDQDMPRLAEKMKGALRQPDAHAVLLAGHGLYTWGSSIDEAVRHVEILEFLLEVIGRRNGAPGL